MKLLNTFLFFLLCLFAVFIIVDLSAHGARFFSKTGLGEILLYYFYTFSANLELFFGLVFLLAALRVLLDLAHHREVVALQMAGLSKKRFLAPFFLFAGCIALICLINSQWFAPHAGDVSAGFKTAYKPNRKPSTKKLYIVSLDDTTSIVYSCFDPRRQELIDVFWVRSPNEFWHMKSFSIDRREGYFVDHLMRDSAKLFAKTESFETRYFQEMPWNHEVILHRCIPYERRSLSTLFLQAWSKPADARVVFSHLYYKLVMPLLPFFILIGICPSVLRYTRNPPTLLIIALSIFVFLAFKSVMDGMLILGENQVLPSYVAIFFPVALILCANLPAFIRLR
ncbi:MAG: LptF/LptG family permease [Verrucomicrobia bacterium]|nr:LptF/LptG family permease [Verrucomicrobiota bacterium]